MKKQIAEFMEQEMRSCSMDVARITPEYIQRMRLQDVPVEEIAEALGEVKGNLAAYGL